MHTHSHLLDGVQPRSRVHQNRSLQHHFLSGIASAARCGGEWVAGSSRSPPSVDEKSSSARDDQTRDAHAPSWRSRGELAAHRVLLASTARR